MVKKKKDIRQFRRSNKAQILWHLYNRGPLSRLELAKLCGLTTPSITQLINDLLIQQEVVEVGSIQRNQTGRREILLDLNQNKNIALGINVDVDYTYFCVANVRKVFKIYKEDTASFNLSKTMELFDNKISEIISEYPEINQICIGISGKIEEGIIENSYGETKDDFNMQKHIEEKFGKVTVIGNNIKAQALSLYKEGNENYLLVTHSPDVGSAMILKGELIRGADKVTGELGHTIIKLDGKPCKCGKNGCLNTYVSDEAIEEKYYEETGIKKDIKEIYALYEKDKVATEILEKVIMTMAVMIANVNELFNPERVFLSGGIFMEDNIYEHGWTILNRCGFSIEVERIMDTEELKATGEAKYIILKSILDV